MKIEFEGSQYEFSEDDIKNIKADGQARLNQHILNLADKGEI